MLGGCSSINYMMYARGCKEDYDAWAAAGCDGWAYDDLLPLFKRSESTAVGDAAFRGRSGPLEVTTPAAPNPLTAKWVDAAVQAGFARNPDYNGATVFGAGPVQQTIFKDGTRASTSRAFLHSPPPNLTVVTHVHAVRVLTRDGAAVGVRFADVAADSGDVAAALAAGATHDVFASREVCVCAGAVGSPQLLQLSGIGPRAHLEALGIDVVADVPEVGANLQDHVSAGVVMNDKTAAGLSPGKVVAPASLLQYAAYGSGPLASSALEAAAYLRTGLTPHHAGPDVQLLLFAASPGGDIMRKNLNIQEELYDASATPRFVTVVCGLHPASRGTVRLRSNDPSKPPVINPAYFTRGRDVDVMLAGVRAAQRVLSAPALADVVGDLATTPLCPHPVDSDDYWRWVFQHVGNTIYHPTSTCRMGVDAGAVVDPRLRVRGVANLRVVDVSVCPVVPSGNTNAPAIVIAEKAAELIAAAHAPVDAQPPPPPPPRQPLARL